MTATKRLYSWLMRGHHSGENPYCGRAWTLNWMVLYAVVLHVFWGAVLLADTSGKALNVTALGDWPIRDPALAGAGFLAIGVAAGLAMHPRLSDTWAGFLLCIPQQFALMLSAFTAGSCIVSGSYADGVPRPSYFIAADQAPAILAMALHTGALLDWALWSRGLGRFWERE